MGVNTEETYHGSMYVAMSRDDREMSGLSSGFKNTHTVDED